LPAWTRGLRFLGFARAARFRFASEEGLDLPALGVVVVGTAGRGRGSWGAGGAGRLGAGAFGERGNGAAGACRLAATSHPSPSPVVARTR
jgi:hypothetical protein